MIVLPAYNEEDNIVPLLEKIDEFAVTFSQDVLVTLVDDGSSDRTVERARAFRGSYPLRLIEHPQNMGLPSAIRTGLREGVAGLGPNDVIVTMDADNTHPPGLIFRMLQRYFEGCDVVIASRFRPGASVWGLAPSRRLLSILASTVLSTVLRFPEVRDYTCGYRLFKVEVVTRALEMMGDDIVTGTGFGCSLELLINVARMKPIFGEAPLNLRYDRKKGASKLRFFKTVQEVLRIVALAARP